MWRVRLLPERRSDHAGQSTQSIRNREVRAQPNGAAARRRRSHARADRPRVMDARAHAGYAESTAQTLSAAFQRANAIYQGPSPTALNIKYVLHEGDIVNIANSLPQWSECADGAQYTQWLCAVCARARQPRLRRRGRQPHDAVSTTPINSGPARPTLRKPSIGGSFEAGKTDNSWHTFNANGEDWLVLAAGVGPTRRRRSSGPTRS